MLNTKLAHTPFSGIPFLERIVDIGCLLVRDYCAAFDASRYDEEMAEYNRKVESDDYYEWEAIGDTALMVLACSAIIRHDVDTLTWAVDSGLQLGKHSKRLLWIPVLVAAAAGNKEIATLVVDRGYQIQEIKLFAKRYVLLEVAAGSNRKDVLEVWLEHLRHIDDEHLQFNVTHLMRRASLGGALPMFDFLSRLFDGKIATLLHDTLIKAMIQMDHSAMAGILKHEGYDRAKFTGKYPKGPIFTVMLAPWDCNSMPLLEVLLNGGLSPDGISPGVNGTPLQRAIEKGRLDIASKLTSYGADVNAYCVPHRMRKRSKVPLLLLAARKRNASMV
ncbi:hypothetical protein N8T08_010671 [Aspergillus melleus]|uniref:Uncharacterized protein n=1 Tax=Aspergillus melleus TaxID=138277 RepID=A0ACC3BC39_9EURO|nr:hypothetical protein N8T08_010671 [Aspergillus melleus]